MLQIIQVGVLIFGLSFSLVFAQGEEESSGFDTDEYIELVNKLKEIPADQQIDLLRDYLGSHPNSIYRAEIEENLNNLNKYLARADPSKQKEQRDTELYLKAVALSQTLPKNQQYALWVQFLKENPQTIYKKDILFKLQELQGPRTQQNEIPRSQSNIANSKTKGIPVVRQLAYKDKDKAVLYAIFPGLIVPGIAHWYTGERLIAGILTALRVTGLSIGLYGLVQRESTPTIIGGVIAGFSYMGDIADAPFSVDRYNENLEKQHPQVSIGPTSLQLSWRF
ncbi:MAG: hypothetical protein KDD48_06660 [Bdellovibrionales bacterium]|nr:hypothetical protein [Bdellovibrionales bacterium]